MDPALRERLAALVNRSRATADRPKPAPRAAGRGRVPPLDRILPGEEVRTASGVCWKHERPLRNWPGADPGLPGRLAAQLAGELPTDLGADPGLALWRQLGFSRGLFLDLETTGFAATPVFLAGLLLEESGEMTFRLYFARSYVEEAPLVEAVAAEIRDRPVAVTFNGKSYDLPFLAERMGRLRVPGQRPGGIFDLLHPARRRWGGHFPDCRLKTLEWHLCRRRRAGDVDGKDIPDTYHRYVRSQDPRPLLGIFTHNLIDLYTLAEITEKVLASSPGPGFHESATG